MPRFGCTCGKSIGLVSSPSARMGHLVSQKDWEDLDPDDSVGVAREVIECPDCGRLWISVDDGYRPYAPDDGAGPAHLFRWAEGKGEG